MMEKTMAGWIAAKDLNLTFYRMEKYDVYRRVQEQDFFKLKFEVAL